jgi:prolycopene isomerase
MTNSKKEKIVVVGGGIAGMVAASYLTRYGKQVLVLEQNHHTGGNMSGFRRGDYYFDGGDQSFESLGIVFPILKDLGIYDKLEWTKVRYRMKSDHFDFFIDSFKDVEEALGTAFPDETGIPELFREVKRVCSFLDKYCTAHSFPALNDTSLSKLVSFLPQVPSLLQWMRFDYREKMCGLVKNPALRKWFTEIGYYRMPFLFFAGFWNLWIKDYWYPVGGMQKLHDLLAEQYTANGGELRCNVLVKKIETKNGKATGVLTSKGEFIEADKVVYAGDYKALVAGILDPELFPKKRRVKVQEAPLTESLVAAYLGVDIPPETLQKQLQSHHAFWFPNFDVIFPNKDSPEDVHRSMWSVVNFFGAENPDFAPAGKSTLVLQTYSSAYWQNFWKNKSMDFKRTDEYKELKRKVGEELVTLSEKFIPDLKSKIEYFDVGTPLTIHRFSLNSEGSTGGWCYDDKVSLSFKAPFLNMISTPVKNVYAAGHYAVWPGGVISAALSGRLVSNIVAGRAPLTPLNC